MDIQPKDTSRGHFYVSLAKSGLRIAAGAFLVQGNVVGAGCLLIGAEILGIVEEMV
jgi:hypothetical protein